MSETEMIRNDKNEAKYSSTTQKVNKNKVKDSKDSNSTMNGPGDDKALDYSASTSTSIGSNDARFLDDSDYEGVQILLSMRSRVFNCKCGEYLDSIKNWSEHQRICSESTEKTSAHREKCQLCNKTFLTCVALNIHSTKKHNKRKIRTDSVMHCPCGQSFTAKWRQNCVHKLNSHGRHCKAFKERETQCSICKKGFINRKSLEYHGLKAHKLAVPVNS